MSDQPLDFERAHSRRTGSYQVWLGRTDEPEGTAIRGSEHLSVIVQNRLVRAYILTFEEAQAIDPDEMDEWYMFGPKTVGAVAVALSRLGLADAKWTARLAVRVAELRHDADRVAAELQEVQ